MSVNVISSHNLPSEYQEVEYIESSGTQYIDTGLSMPNGFKTEMRVSTNIGSGYRFFLGAEDDESPYYRNFFGINGSNHYFLGAYSNLTSSEVMQVNQFYTFNVSTISGNRYYKVNDIDVLTYTDNTTPLTSRNLYLFRINSNSGGGYFSSIKLCYCKIYDNDTLVRDFIPCYRKSDDVIGLYDLVNGVFYTNAGTGTFLKGADVAPYTIEKQKMNVLAGGSRLPAEYQKVEYMESTGTQYINTGVIGENAKAYRIIYDIQFTNTSTRQLMGFGDDSNQYWGIKASGKYEIEGYTSSFDAGSRDIIVWNYDCANKISSLTINSDYEFNTINNLFPVPQNKPLTLSSISGIYNCYLKIYGNKVYVDNTLVRDFIPCYRKSDDVIGLYDTVNGVFYTNAGTGTFLKGNDVSNINIQPVKVNILKKLLPDTYQQVEYISFYQTHCINTGISSADDIGCEVKYLTTGSYGTSRVPIGTNTTNETYYQPMAFWANYMRYGWNGINTTVSYQGLFPVDTQIVSKFNYMNDRQVIYQDNVYASSLPTYTANSYNIYIGPNLMGNIYYAKFTRGQNVIAEFIPCYRKSDNEIGMYDLVNDVFYTNAGTGTFEKGNDVNQYVIIKI